MKKPEALPEADKKKLISYLKNPRKNKTILVFVSKGSSDEDEGLYSAVSKYAKVVDFAKELYVPETNISLFFLKNYKIYIARPTRSMGKNEFWYYISENGEWINFDISTKAEDIFSAIVNYDHRDNRYAFVNLSEIIKRNYKDKSTKWWKEYSGAITIIIAGIMFIGAMWFFFWRTGTMLEQMAPISENFKVSSEIMAKAVELSQNINSGVVQG